jgi:hypothetical protein
MTMYRVTTTLSQRELVDYLAAVGSVDVKIEVVNDSSAPKSVSADQPATPRPPRRKRRTKAQILADNAMKAAA